MDMAVRYKLILSSSLESFLAGTAARAATELEDNVDQRPDPYRASFHES